jgi:hypothetical protein
VRLSPQGFRRHVADVQRYIDNGAGDCVGDLNQEKWSWALRGLHPTRDTLVIDAANVHPAAGEVTSPAAAT